MSPVVYAPPAELDREPSDHDRGESEARDDLTDKGDDSEHTLGLVIERQDRLEIRPRVGHSRHARNPARFPTAARQVMTDARVNRARSIRLDTSPDGGRH